MANKPGGQFSLEQLELEMLERAKEVWEVEKDLPMVAFDPVVKMLIGACALEVRKIANEIQESQNRVVERLADIMMPDILRGPVPASTIMQVEPVEPETIVSPDLQMSCVRDDKEFAFSPCGTFKILDARVAKCLLLLSDNLIDITNHTQQALIDLHDRQDLEVSNRRSLYIGLDIDEQIEGLDSLSFFFNWAKVPLNTSENYRKLLKFVQCKVGDIKLNTTSGIPQQSNDYDHTLAMVDNTVDVGLINKSRINAHYKTHFITVHFPGDFSLSASKKLVPKSVEHLIDPKANRIEKPLLWFEFEFPAAFPNVALREQLSHCLVNCFPAMNRKLETKKHLSYGPQMNVISLKTNAQFLSIQNVTDNTGTTFHNKVSVFDRKDTDGSYYLRRGGVGRIDTRRAKELIVQLQDLLKDESVAFTALNPNDLVGDVKNLKQIVAKIDDNISHLEMYQESPWYIILNQAKNIDDNFFEVILKFWTTLGTMANDIPPGEIDRASYVDYGPAIKNVTNITVTQGGRDHLKETHIVDAYRYHLLTSERIATVEDIKAYCRSYLGNDLDGISISKGVIVDSNPQNGLVKTINIELVPDSTSKLSDSDWDLYIYELSKDLNNKWTGSLPLIIDLKSKKEAN